jgi:hypothetical protein
MPLAWLSGSKALSIEELIARKKYGKAVELLRDQFRQGSRDPRMRLQLADVLILAGKGSEAIPILTGLADEFAREGFAAKSIAILKKIDKIEPGRADVEQKLAHLIHQEKQRTAPAPSAPPPVPAAPQPASLGIEERAPDEIPPDELAPMSEEAFGEELLEVAHALADELPVLDEPLETAAPAVASPLFSDFSEAELVAVMHGMRLLSFEAGDIVITEGEPGDSLFVLTTGSVKAFIRNPSGRHVLVREMSEGAFFGEISILTGKPRTATVTAATRCELLELDKAALDRISETHPGVRKALKEFYDQRAGSKDEETIRRMPFGG